MELSYKLQPIYPKYPSRKDSFNLEKSIRTKFTILIKYVHKYIEFTKRHFLLYIFTQNELGLMIDALLDMTIGMIFGMIASPLMMKGIKVIRQRRKVDRILRKISQEKMNQLNLSQGINN